MWDKAPFNSRIKPKTHSKREIITWLEDTPVSTQERAIAGVERMWNETESLQNSQLPLFSLTHRISLPGHIEREPESSGRLMVGWGFVLSSQLVSVEPRFGPHWIYPALRFTLPSQVNLFPSESFSSPDSKICEQGYCTPAVVSLKPSEDRSKDYVNCG